MFECFLGSIMSITKSQELSGLSLKAAEGIKH